MEAIHVDLIGYENADFREILECFSDDKGTQSYDFTEYTGYGACFDCFGAGKTKLFDITVSFNTPATDGQVLLFCDELEVAAAGTYVVDIRLSDGTFDEVWFRGSLTILPEGATPP